MRTTLVTLTLVAVALLATGAAAKDLETRWHEAYVLEVVEGKVADAAKAYLELLREELPAHLDRETRFRFAVCCALLGRADEARSRLAELAADGDLPASFRARVDEYRKALEGIGVGTETEKRLEELVFALGRITKVESGHPEYRDFLIIGKSAVPVLERLLARPDVSLRTHAYRILCQMNEPRVLGALPPPSKEGGYYAWLDLRDFLNRRPDGVPRIETLLLEAVRQGVKTVLRDRIPENFWQGLGLSVRFLKALAEIEGAEWAMRYALFDRPWSPELVEAAKSWVRDGRDGLASEIGYTWALRRAQPISDAEGKRLEDAEIYPVLCRRAAGGHLESDGNAQNGLRGYGRALAPELCRAAVVDYLSRVESGELRMSSLFCTALIQGLHPLAERVDAKEHAKLLRRWMALGSSPPVEHVWHVVRRLAEDDARALLSDFLATFERRDRPGYSVRIPVPHAAPEDVRLLILAMEAATEARAKSLAGEAVGQVRNTALPVSYRRALAEAWPRVMELTPVSTRRSLAKEFAFAAQTLEPAEASRILVRLAAVDHGGEQRSLLNTLLLTMPNLSSEARGEYLRGVRVPALAAAAEVAGAREDVVRIALYYLTSDGKPGQELLDARPEVLRFLGDHVEILARNGRVTGTLAEHPEVFPLTAWVPHVPLPVWDSQRLEAISLERANAAAETFAEHPDGVNLSVLRFARKHASPEVTTRLYDLLYESADERLLGLLVGESSLGGLPASPAAMENALVVLQEREDVSPYLLGRLVEFLAERRPSEKLFPVVRRLLDSDEPDQVQQGIRLAAKLGNKELVPFLVDKLDSMHDATRTAAKGAIDSILEIGRIKEEARKRMRD